METRRASIQRTSRTVSSGTALGRRRATTNIQKMLDCLGTCQNWFRKHSNIERCSKTVEPLKQPLDQKIDRLRHREAELLQHVRRHNDDGAKVDAPRPRNRTNLEPHESRTFRRPASCWRITQRSCAIEKASAVPPNLSRNLEAKVVSHKY